MKPLDPPTAIGFTAILMWATLALLTTWSGTIPPFQLTALCFTLASGIGLLMLRRQGGSLRQFQHLPLLIWALGIYGLFGYHFFYFMALRQAPAVEASLIAYLWPLLVVLFAAFLPGERLRWFHVLGAIAGLIGASLLVTQGQGIQFNPDYTLGYLSALACALIWSSYSVLCRRCGSVPTATVGGFCLLSALLAWGCHFLFETSVMPSGTEWLAILAMGLGPIGLAFFTWDYGVKHGNIKVLGTLSYLAPLLSTLLLVLFGLAEANWQLGVACILIVGGAMVASGLGQGRSPSPPPKAQS
jgi:drug/metabolite transporter (DMT)-like permease